MKHQSKAGLFLMELMVAVVFFSLSAALCLQLFVKAKQMNDSSLLESHAAIAASSIAECYRSGQLTDYYRQDKEGYVHFDKKWNVKLTPSTFKALLKEENDTLSIRIYQGDVELYSLTCMQYQKRLVKEDTNEKKP